MPQHICDTLQSFSGSAAYAECTPVAIAAWGRGPDDAALAPIDAIDAGAHRCDSVAMVPTAAAESRAIAPEPPDPLAPLAVAAPATIQIPQHAV